MMCTELALFSAASSAATICAADSVDTTFEDDVEPPHPLRTRPTTQRMQ
jgi:hypothetical protein